MQEQVAPSFGSFYSCKTTDSSEKLDPFAEFLNSNDLIGPGGGYIPATVLVVLARIGGWRTVRLVVWGGGLQWDTRGWKLGCHNRPSDKISNLINLNLVRSKLR